MLSKHLRLPPQRITRNALRALSHSLTTSPLPTSRRSPFSARNNPSSTPSLISRHHSHTPTDIASIKKQLTSVDPFLRSKFATSPQACHMLSIGENEKEAVLLNSEKAEILQQKLDNLIYLTQLTLKNINITANSPLTLPASVKKLSLTNIQGSINIPAHSQITTLFINGILYEEEDLQQLKRSTTTIQEITFHPV